MLLSIFIPVLTDRTGRDDDPTRVIVEGREVFADADMIFSTSYHGNMYGVLGSDIKAVKIKGKVGLLDLHYHNKKQL